MSTIKIHNAETNEVIEREMTEEEFAKLETERISTEQAETERLIAEEQKAAEEAARLSAKLAIYAKLGLTEEEINTLIS